METVSWKFHSENSGKRYCVIGNFIMKMEVSNAVPVGKSTLVGFFGWVWINNRGSK